MLVKVTRFVPETEIVELPDEIFTKESNNLYKIDQDWMQQVNKYMDFENIYSIRDALGRLIIKNDKKNLLPS